MTTASAKQRHLLFAGQVIFTQNDLVQAAPGNALIMSDQLDIIPLRLLAKAQQALQANFRTQVDDPDIVIENVVIQNIMDLGIMTDVEFNKTMSVAVPKTKLKVVTPVPGTKEKTDGPDQVV